MTRKNRIATALILMLVGLAAAASAKDEEPAFMANVFPPDLIMKHGREIGLAPAQRKKITSAVSETQATALELQWEMQDAAQKLGDLMAHERIDEGAALETAKRLMDLEGQVKRAHLRLLVRIKNTLDPEQQRRLSELRQR